MSDSQLMQEELVRALKMLHLKISYVSEKEAEETILCIREKVEFNAGNLQWNATIVSI